MPLSAPRTRTTLAAAALSTILVGACLEAPHAAAAPTAQPQAESVASASGMPAYEQPTSAVRGNGVVNTEGGPIGAGGSEPGSNLAAVFNTDEVGTVSGWVWWEDQTFDATNHAASKQINEKPGAGATVYLTSKLADGTLRTVSAPVADNGQYTVRFGEGLDMSQMYMWVEVNGRVVTSESPYRTAQLRNFTGDEPWIPVLVPRTTANQASIYSANFALTAPEPENGDDIAPVIKADSQRLNIDEAANFSIDVDDSEAAVDVTGLPEGLSFDEATRTFTGTPTTRGSYDVTVYATDQAGNSATSKFHIDVVKAPSIEVPGEKAVIFLGQSMPEIAMQKDDKVASVSVTGLPTGITFDEENMVISGTPEEVGTFEVTIHVRNTEGVETEKVISFVVKSGVEITDFATTRPLRAGEEIGAGGLTLAPTVEDPAGVIERYEIEGLPEGLNYDPQTGKVEGKVTTSGTYRITITPQVDSKPEEPVVFDLVVDGKGVVRGEHMPQQAPVAGKEIAPIGIETAAMDPGSKLEIVGLPEGLYYDAAKEAIVGTPEKSGTAQVKARVIDGNGKVTSEHEFAVKVLAESEPEPDPSPKPNPKPQPTHGSSMPNSSVPVLAAAALLLGLVIAGCAGGGFGSSSAS